MKKATSGAFVVIGLDSTSGVACRWAYEYRLEMGVDGNFVRDKYLVDDCRNIPHLEGNVVFNDQIFKKHM